MFCGCSQKVEPPKPLPVEQISTSLQTAFKGANVEVGNLASAAAGAVQSREYDKALFVLQSLSTHSGLTREQRDIAARALLTVNQELAAQATTGNPQAAKTLEYQRMNK